VAGGEGTLREGRMKGGAEAQAVHVVGGFLQSLERRRGGPL